MSKFRMWKIVIHISKKGGLHVTIPYYCFDCSKKEARERELLFWEFIKHADKFSIKLCDVTGQFKSFDYNSAKEFACFSNRQILGYLKFLDAAEERWLIEDFCSY